MNVWAFKVNTRLGWEFDRYFRSRSAKPYPLADDGWIRSATSLRYLREEVKRGDLFLCYETDRKRVLGVARAAGDGRDVGQGPLLDLDPPAKAVRLRNPLRRHPDLDYILAFSPQRGRGTVQRIEPDEARRLRAVILRKNPDQAREIARLWPAEVAFRCKRVRRGNRTRAPDGGALGCH